MPFELPTDLTPELVPLSWLIGHWEGTGVLGYAEEESQQFEQHITFSQNGLPYLIYTNESWLIDEDGQRLRPLTMETGIWQLDRPQNDADSGPGMLPADIVPALRTADDVEKLRNGDGGFDIVATIVHPGGVSELYVGQIKGPRIDLSTDAVMRAPGAKDYRAATRMYGLVEGDLLWAWDIAAAGLALQSHASGRLHRA
ncbi:FABP family protein [Tersicoccus sp. MR15.9]|uniref:FABP family protein n=1 Tax=Tersicoccus mangrovi TaxID=3121635 RepID=UPI002FE6A700